MDPTVNPEWIWWMAKNENLCNHANEMPNYCVCRRDCTCRKGKYRTCWDVAGPGGGSEYVWEQPKPKKNKLPKVKDLVIKDMETKARAGRKKYGVWLQAHNGRDALLDAYSEAIDLCQYLRQAIYERDGK